MSSLERRLATAAVAVGLALAAAGCRPGRDGAESMDSTEPPHRGGWFEEVARTAGVDFVHVRATGSEYWFPEISSGGGGWLDYDGDGDLDLYLVQGGDIEAGPAAGFANALYRNEGDGSFVDVTARAGVGDPGYGMGLAVGDYDVDGDEDLYVTNLGANRLYRNQGDGTFSDVTAVAGVGEDAWTTSAAFVDIDDDQDLDLFLVNYIAWSPQTEATCFGVGGARDYCGPNRYEAPAPDTLYRNDGDSRFTDVSESSGIRSAFGNGLGVAVLDFDADGRSDLYVANDLMPNQLWINSGGGRFTDEAVQRGCAVNMAGAAEAGMGVAVGDVDRDGLADLLVTHLNQETNTLYLNRGSYCEDATARAGLAIDSLARTGFGTVLADFDHDGWQDLWVTNGRVARGRLAGGGDPFADPDLLYRGTGPARFELAAEPPEAAVARPLTAAGDYDLDGDLDLVEVNSAGPVRLFRNRIADGRGWVALRILNRGGAAEAGARVRLRGGGSESWSLPQRASSYCASNTPVAHFGVPAGAAPVEELLVVRPHAGRRAYRQPPVERLLTVPRKRPG